MTKMVSLFKVSFQIRPENKSVYLPYSRVRLPWWSQTRSITFSGGILRDLQLLSLKCCHHVERNGSGVELQTLDYENRGSNPVLRYKNLGQVFLLYLAPVNSAV